MYVRMCVCVCVRVCVCVCVCVHATPPMFIYSSISKSEDFQKRTCMVALQVLINSSNVKYHY